MKIARKREKPRDIEECFRNLKSPSSALSDKNSQSHFLNAIVIVNCMCTTPVDMHSPA